MTRFILLLLTCVTLFAAPEASARRFKLPLIIPIGSSGGVNGTLVKVEKLPPAFVYEGRHFDLGYYWPKSGTPRWVGYLGSNEYVSGAEGALEAWLSEEGVALPEVPDRGFARERTGGGGVAFGLLATLAVFAGLIWAVAKLCKTATRAATGAVQSVLIGKTDEQEVVWKQRATDQMTAQANRQGATIVSPRASRVATPVRQLPRGLVPSGALGQRQAFGRR
jgi:hypothetical protein